MADLTAGRNFGIIIPETKLHHHTSETSPRQVCDAGFSSCTTTNIMSFDLVFFGGTGDLTWRKLMPALFQAFRHGKLPALCLNRHQLAGMRETTGSEDQGRSRRRATCQDRQCQHQDISGQG